MERVLITGVAGFIGSYVAETFLRKGFSVLGVDNLDPYYPLEYKKVHLKRLTDFPGFRFFRRDFSEDPLDDLMEGVAGVVHIGAKAGVRASIRDPESYFRTNTIGTLRIVETMRRKGVRRMVMASTSSVYAGHTPPFTEDMKTDNPISPYAASKKAAENLLYTYHHLHGMDFFILRYFTVYGPEGRPDMSVFKLLYAAFSGEEFPLYGDGEQKRGFTYIEDVAKATFLAFQNVKGYEIINVGNPRRHSLRRVISLVERYSGREVRLRRMPPNRADIPETEANTEKAERLLGWRPETTLEEGIERTARWFEENWESIRGIFPAMPDI